MLFRSVGGPGLLRGVHLSVPDPHVRLIAFALGGAPAAPTRAAVSLRSKSNDTTQQGRESNGRLPPGVGRHVVQSDCTLCHGVDTITRARFSRAGWRVTVRDMMNRGAPVTTSQYQTVVDYLTRNFGTSGTK